MKNIEITVVVLAAGKGTRMESDKPKVLHEIYGVPMITHVLDALVPLVPDRMIVVVGHKSSGVKASLLNYNLSFAFQNEQLGTGHAVMSAAQLFPLKGGVVLILCGDTPLIRSETLREMLAAHLEKMAALTVMTTILEDSTGYGRILSDKSGDLVKIVEEKDASSLQKEIKEVNAGIYCVNQELLLQVLRKIKNNNQQREYYLTDIVEIIKGSGLKVDKYVCVDPQEILGVNSKEELALADKLMCARWL
ncbi:MAG: NTP transferase domain-containing protein [Proteobacteria bacterium]|nr:NTP transferase domain-containing protein [Pseudomonadota bacterium]MBU1715848.1 NTP transferase domain-containing protein [Pseudomonadota bacterium]